MVQLVYEPAHRLVEPDVDGDGVSLHGHGQDGPYAKLAVALEPVRHRVAEVVGKLIGGGRLRTRLKTDPAIGKVDTVDGDFRIVGHGRT